MKKEGGCGWYQSMGLSFVSISADFKFYFKGWPFKKHVLERLNNFSCILTESCGHRGQKFNTLLYSPAIDLIAGDVHPVSWIQNFILNLF
jgi:hypothetical protein